MCVRYECVQRLYVNTEVYYCMYYRALCVDSGRHQRGVARTCCCLYGATWGGNCHDKFGQEKKSGQRQVFAATNGPPLNKISLQFIATFCVLTVYHKSAIVHVNSLLPTCVLNSSTDSRIIFMYLLVNLCDSSTFICTALNRSYSSLSIYFQHLLHVVQCWERRKLK